MTNEFFEDGSDSSSNDQSEQGDVAGRGGTERHWGRKREKAEKKARDTGF